MTLKELLSKFDNDTYIKIEVYENNRSTIIYYGQIHYYIASLLEKWPDNNFRDREIVNVRIRDGILEILLEDS
jgi:hypothetical protein